MTMQNELLHYDAIGLASLIRNKELSPLELLTVTFERAQAINPKINAIVHYCMNEARNAAEKVDLNSPFAGLPFLLKDLTTLLKGVELSQGSLFFKDFIPDHDSEIVKRFKNAGMVIFGKTNTPEFGMCCSTEPDYWGPTRNPWDFTRSPGGSSGGSAAAVAARIVPLAHATDAGGSIRIPAAFCGVVGLKPTRARMPVGPDVGEGVAGLAVPNVISITLRDSAAVLDTIAGPELGAPYIAPAPEGSYQEALLQAPKQLRIAFSKTMGFDIKVDDECQRAVEHTIKLCESLGHIVEEAAPDYDAELMLKTMMVFFTATTKFAINMRSRMLGRGPSPAELEHNTQVFAESGDNYSGTDYLAALNTMHLQARKIAYFFEKFDVLITPTMAKARLNLGVMKNPVDSIMQSFIRFSEITPFTGIWNQTGQPALSLPLYWPEENLPIGVQLIGKYGDEKTLFQLGGQLEQLAPWAQRIPAWVKKI